MQRQGGFTLIELMVTIVIAGIVLSTAIAGFGGMQKSLNRSSARERLVSSLRMARQLSVTRHRAVIVGFGDGITTTNVTGWSLHIDNDNNRVQDSGERVIVSVLPRGTKLSRVNLSPADSIRFDPSGLLATGTSGGSLILDCGRGAPDTFMVTGTGMVYER